MCCVERNRFKELPTIYKMTLTEQIMVKRDDDVDDEISCGVERNRFKKLPTIYKMISTEQTMKKRDDGVDDEITCGVERNRFKKLSTIYKMTSTEQIMDKRDDDVDDEISYGVERNRFKGLPNVYKMSLTEQKMEKGNYDVDDEISYGVNRNRFKGLLSIYKMSSTKQTMKKRNDDVEASANLLDSMVPDINVPIMKPSKTYRFNFRKWIDNEKKISENVQRRSSQIANRILNTTIVKSHLPAKIEELIKMVMETEFSDKSIIHKYFEGKLSAKRITAFKNNAIIYKIKILDKVDPLNQMMLLNERKTYLLNKRVTLLKGIKCNETLKVKFKKLGSKGRMIEKSLSFTSRPQVIMNEYDIESGLQSMRSDIEFRIDRFTMEGSGWAVIGLLNHDLHVNSYDPFAARSYIPLPSEIQNKKATINIKNEDDKCFSYCLGRALDPFPEKAHLENVSKHLKSVCESLGLNNIKTPVNVQDLPKIETQFKESIYLYGHSDSNIYPIQTTQSTAKKHVDLLVTSNSETNHLHLE